MFYMSDDLLRHGIFVETMLLKFKYDIVKNFNNKLKDNNLSFAESKKKKIMMILLKKKMKYLKVNN